MVANANGLVQTWAQQGAEQAPERFWEDLECVPQLVLLWASPHRWWR
jgi:hypothetical protein